jgi:hypothetical protein
MKNFKTIVSLMLILISITLNSCEKNDAKSAIEGTWVRLPGPSGDRTDLAIGGIPGEPSNRVYMCEKKGSNTAGFYKGTYSSNTIVWDAVYNLPNFSVKIVDNELELDCNVCLPTKYQKGTWSGECGPLQYSPKNIYYKWTTSSTCPLPSGISLIYNHPDLLSTLTKNQQYGPLAAGPFEIIIKDNINGSTPTYYTLSEPPAGYKRIYTHNIFQFSTSVGRCQFYINAPIPYVDQPL